MAQPDDFGDLYADVSKTTTSYSSEEGEESVVYGKAETPAPAHIVNNDNPSQGQGEGNHPTPFPFDGNDDSSSDEEEDLHILVNEENVKDSDTDNYNYYNDNMDNEARPHSLHHHSTYFQLKIVRPGAVAFSGAGLSSDGVNQNQSKRSVFNGSVGGCCRHGTMVGRGHWSSIGAGGRGNLLRNFRPGVVMPPWTTGAMPRRKNAFEFSLPLNKTIFDINIDKFEEKRWQQPGVDVTDFFNFDLNEDSWKNYCRQMEQLRLETFMESKNHVYGSGQCEEVYDLDLPSKTVTVIGLLEASKETMQHGLDIGSSAVTNFCRGLIQGRPLPTGRAIQVERGIGERFPSVVARRPRHRDSDAVIQIALHDPIEDDSATPTNAPEMVDNTSQKEDFVKVDSKIDWNWGWSDMVCSLQVLEPVCKLEETPHGNIHSEKSYSERGIGHEPVHDIDGLLPLPTGPPILCRQVSNAETGMYPAQILGLPPAVRQSAPYQSYLDVEDYHSNVCIGNQGGLTAADDYHAKREVIKKWLPAVRSLMDREKHSKDEMHFDMASETNIRQYSELKVQPAERDINHYVHSIKRKKLSFRKEVPDSVAAYHSHLINLSRSGNSKTESGSSRDPSKDQEDVEQLDSIYRCGEWYRSTAERKELEVKEEAHCRPRKDYCWNCRCDADKSIISVKVGDILHYHRGEEDQYLERYPERMSHNKAKKERFDNHMEGVGCTKSWQARAGRVWLRGKKYEDERRMDRFEKVEKSKHGLRGQDTKRLVNEEHQPAENKKDADSRDDHYGGEEIIKQREAEGHIVGKQKKDEGLYLRKNKQELIHEANLVDIDGGIIGQTDQDDICRDKLDRDDLHIRRKEKDSWTRDEFTDTQKIKQMHDTWRWREREDEEWRKAAYEVYCKPDREGKRSLLSEKSKPRKDKIYRNESNAKEETRFMNIQRDKLYEKRRNGEHGKGNDCIDKDNRSSYHERDDMCSREDHLIYKQRSIRHDYAQIRYEVPGSGHYEKGRKFYKEKHKLHTIMSKEFHRNDRHVSASFLSNAMLRNALTINRGRRKPEDYFAVLQNVKVSNQSMDIQESERVCDCHPDHRTRNMKKMQDVLKRMHKQLGAGLDVVKLEKGFSSCSLSENEYVRSWHPNFDSLEHYKENTQERGSCISRKEVTSPRQHAINIEEEAKKVENSLTKMEIKSGKDKYNVTESRAADIEGKKAVMEDVVYASGGEILNTGSINHQHLDAFAKLEKRRERFKKTIIIEKPIHRMAQYEATIQKEIGEVKQQRPARKRRWGSG